MKHSLIADQHVPCYLAFAEGQGAVAVFAFRLRGVGRCPGNLQGLELNGWLTRQYAWPGKLVAALLHPENEAREVELRYTREQRAGEHLDVFVIGRGFGDTADMARAKADELWLDLRAQLEMDRDVHPMELITDPAELADVLHPHAIAEVVEIRRAGFQVAPHVKGALGLDGGDARPTGALQAQYTFPLPFSTEHLPSNLHDACRMLITYPTVTSLSIVLRSSARLPESFTTAVLTGAQNLALVECNTVQHYLPRLAEQAVNLRIFLTSESPITHALVNTVAAELLSCPTSGWDKLFWAREAVARSVTEHGLCWLPEDDLLAIRYLPAEAGCAFRLPLITDRNDVPGLCTIYTHFAYRPDDLAATGVLMARQGEAEIRLSDEDRRRHVYVLGQTGSGKTTLLKTMILSDIADGRGLCVFDPHGTLIDDLLAHIPPARWDDVLLIDLSDRDYPVGLNLLECDDEETRDHIVSEFMQMVQKIWDPHNQGLGMFGPQYSRVMRAAVMTALSFPEGGTVVDIPRLLEDQAYAEYRLKDLTDETLKKFWTETWVGMRSSQNDAETIGWITNKVEIFRQHSGLRRFVGQSRSTFHPRRLMDEGRIVLVNLSKGKLSTQDSSFLGSLLLAKFISAAMSRVDVAEAERRLFTLYIDEFQSFSNADSLSRMIAEARKYGLALVLAHQNLAQLPSWLAECILGNVGTMALFRPGIIDAERISPYFAPHFSGDDLLRLGLGEGIMRMLIAGKPGRPFVFQNVLTDGPVFADGPAVIRERSRIRYAHLRDDVDAEINRRGQIPVDQDALQQVSGICIGCKDVLPVHFSLDDRLKHTYIIGQPGTGKSTLIQQMVVSDIIEERGVCVIDPHGDLVEAVLARIPPTRAADVLLVDPTDLERPVGINLLEMSDAGEEDFITSEFMRMIHKIWDPLDQNPMAFGPWYSQAMRAAVKTAMAFGGTVLDIPRLLEDDAYAQEKKRYVKDPAIAGFWDDWKERKQMREHKDLCSWVTAKVDFICQNDSLRRILGQPKSTLDFRQVLAEKKIVLVNFAKGVLSTRDASLLGGIILTKLFAMTLQRGQIPAAERTFFGVYIDEFHNFTTETLTQMIAESRKFGVGLCFAHQNLKQLPPWLLETVLGSVGNKIFFRIGLPDVTPAREYLAPYIAERRLLSLSVGEAVGHLLFDNKYQMPFIFHTEKDSTPANRQRAEVIRELSRRHYGRPLAS